MASHLSQQHAYAQNLYPPPAPFSAEVPHMEPEMPSKRDRETAGLSEGSANGTSPDIVSPGVAGEQQTRKKQKRNKPTLSCHECVERKTKVRESLRFFAFTGGPSDERQ